MWLHAKIFREPVNAISHMAGALSSIVGLALMVVFAAIRADAWHVVSFAVFGTTLFLMYTSSFLYHGLKISEKTLEPAGLFWLGLSGLFYSGGAIIYSVKRPNPFPGIFGFHEIWHFFVLLGSACHFWLVFKYLMYINPV